jgi:hypothetical protein
MGLDRPVGPPGCELAEQVILHPGEFDTAPGEKFYQDKLAFYAQYCTGEGKKNE